MPRISLPKISIKKAPLVNFSRSSGFTLIEIMIVLGILSALIAIGLPRINRNNNNLKQVVRQLAVLGKEIRNQSRLKNLTHRLVFQMGEKESTYWVESASGLILAEKKTEESSSFIDEKDKKPNPFQKTDKFFKQERKLPGELKFKSIETSNQKEAVTQGTAYIYFTPEGMVEKSVIQIGKGDITWSLIFNPLTGHADFVEKAFSLKDIPKL